MHRFYRVRAARAALAAPAMATAAETTPAKTNAAKECKALKKASGTPANFAAAVRLVTKAKVTEKNAYGKCVSARTKDETNEAKAAKQNAAQQCRKEQEADATAFKNTYGTNANKSNAFGKCVSQKARANKAKMDAKDQQRVNAARSCRKEQKAGATAFKNEYGTNRNKSNAFGKCVSRTAKAQSAPTTQS